MIKNDKNTQSYWNDMFLTEFARESDRACVILAAALLEQALETLIKAKLCPNPTQSDPLFDSANAPLSTFSSKIDLAFRIGVIPSHIARELHLIRKIRNEFAHNITGCDFSDGAIQSRVMELTKSQGVPDSAPDIRAQMPEGPRGDFQIICSWLSWQLWAYVKDVEAITDKEGWFARHHPLKPKAKEAATESEVKKIEGGK